MGPWFSHADVGDYYADADGDLWRLVVYSSVPTASLERVTGDDQQIRDVSRRDRVGGAVGAPIFEGFRKMVPEEPA